MWERHVEDVGEATSANDIVVIEEMAAFGVGIDRHVLLEPRERTAAGDCTQEAAELGRVEGIAKGEEVREEDYLVWRKEVEGREVACLIDLCRLFATSCDKEKGKYLVYVRLFLGKGELGNALVLDLDEEVVVEELLDEGMLEGGVGPVRGA